MNKRFFLLAFIACAASGQNLMTLAVHSTAASFSASGSSIGTYRIEFRIENVAPSVAVLSNGGGVGNLNCSISAGLQLACSQGGDGTGQGVPSYQLIAGQDVRVRFQRDSGALTYTLETWSGSCTNHFLQKVSIGATAPLPQTSNWTFGPSISTAFLRAYSMLDTAGDCPVDAPIASGDLFDFTFEGNSLSDRSSHHYTMAASGSTFATSTTYAPLAVLKGWTTPKPVSRATNSITLDGSASVSFTYPGTGAVASYFWQQLTGPAQSSYSSRTVAKPTITPPVAGQYTYQLTVSDATGATAVSTMAFGVVATDGNGVVVIPNSNFQKALGNPLMHGASPWPWYEVTEAADVDLMSTPVQAPVNEVAGPGKVSIPSTGINQLSGGNITANTYGGVAIQGSGTNFSAADVGTYIAVNWDPDGNGSYQGTYVAYINSVISSTIAVTNSYQILEPYASFASGLNWGRLAVGSGSCSPTVTVSGGRVTALTTAGCSGYYWWTNGSPSTVPVTFSGGAGSGCTGIYANITTAGTVSGYSGLPCGSGYTSAPAATLNPASDWRPYQVGDAASYVFNFYEAGLAIAREYAKTGLIAYQTEFHTFCTQWWRWALDSGWTNQGIPRNLGLDFIVACATDPSWAPPPNMFAGVARLVQASAPAIVYNSAGMATAGYNPTQPALLGSVDPRESSYALRWTAKLAEIGGSYGLSTTTWCGYLKNQVTNFAIADTATPYGDTNGTKFYAENLFYGNVTYPAAGHPPVTGPFGTSTWRDNGLPLNALIPAYTALADPATCNDPALAAQLYNNGTGLIPSIAAFVWNYALSPDGGVFYSGGYESNYNVTATPIDVWNNWTSGAPTQTGNIAVTNGSTSVVGTSTYFTRLFYPGASMQILGITYSVSSVTDDTHLALTTNYSGATQNYIGNFGNNCTIALVNGSSSVTGSSCNFNVMFAGPSWIGIVSGSGYNDRNIYGVTVTSATTLTLNPAFTGTTQSGLGAFVYAPASLTGQEFCGILSQFTYCNPDPYNGRNLTQDIGYSAAWLYTQTGNQTYLNHANYYYNKIYGGAAGGAGSLGPPTGTSTYTRPGTIAVNSSTATVTGTGTLFTQQFTNGSSIVIADNSGGYTWANYPGSNPTYYTLNIATVVDNTHITLSGNYPGTTAGNIAMFYNPADPQWPGADGGAGNLGEILPVCNASSPPCGIGDFVPKYGKPLGMASGAGNVPLAMGHRMGGLANPVNRTLGVAFNLGSVPHATQVAVSLTYPDGTSVSNTCSASPCSVVGDARESGAQLIIQYKAAGGAVLAQSSQPAFVKVQ